MILATLPFVAQVLFTYANLPRIRVLVGMKRSDQHSVENITVTLAGHLILAPFYWVEVGTVWGVAANIAAISLAAAYLGLVLYYRRFPGGR